MRNNGTIRIYDSLGRKRAMERSRGGEMAGVKERMMMDYERPQGTVLVVFSFNLAIVVQPSLSNIYLI